MHVFLSNHKTTKSLKNHIATRFCFSASYQTLENEFVEIDPMNQGTPSAHKKKKTKIDKVYFKGISQLSNGEVN